MKIKQTLDGPSIKEIKKLKRQRQQQYNLFSIVHQIDCLPTTSYLDIDPHQSLLPFEDNQELSPQAFKKRYQALNIRAPKTKTEVADPQVLIKEAVQRKNASKQISCRGYGWLGISTDRRHRLIPLVEIIRGINYVANFPMDLRDYGVVLMSSITNPKRDIIVRLDSLPIKDSSQWINLATSSTTTRKIYDSLHQGYTSPEVYFTFYDIAAFLKRSQADLEELISNPVLLPNKSFLRFAKKLNNQVIKRYEKNGKVIPRKLNLAEKEDILWHKVHKERFYENCFVEDSTFSYIPALIGLTRI